MTVSHQSNLCLNTHKHSSLLTCHKRTVQSKEADSKNPLLDQEKSTIWDWLWWILLISYSMFCELMNGGILKDPNVPFLQPISPRHLTHFPDINHSIFASRCQVLPIHTELHTPDSLSTHQHISFSRYVCLRNSWQMWRSVSSLYIFLIDVTLIVFSVSYAVYSLTIMTTFTGVLVSS
mgnify:FL=1